MRNEGERERRKKGEEVGKEGRNEEKEKKELELKCSEEAHSIVTRLIS